MVKEVLLCLWVVIVVVGVFFIKKFVIVLCMNLFMGGICVLFVIEEKLEGFVDILCKKVLVFDLFFDFVMFLIKVFVLFFIMFKVGKGIVSFFIDQVLFVIGIKDFVVNVVGCFEFNIVKFEEFKKVIKVIVFQSFDENYQFLLFLFFCELIKFNIVNFEDEYCCNVENFFCIFSEFGVEVIFGEIYVGFVIICYEVVFVVGVCVEKIVGFDKNIVFGMCV